VTGTKGKSLSRYTEIGGDRSCPLPKYFGHPLIGRQCQECSVCCRWRQQAKRTVLAILLPSGLSSLLGGGDRNWRELLTAHYASFSQNLICPAGSSVLLLLPLREFHEGLTACIDPTVLTHKRKH
jgi:hypothetical protein